MQNEVNAIKKHAVQRTMMRYYQTLIYFIILTYIMALRLGEKKFDVSKSKTIHINNRIIWKLIYIECKISEFQQLNGKYQINHQQAFTATCH
jgi:hypothetical protein